MQTGLESDFARISRAKTRTVRKRLKHFVLKAQGNE